MVVLGLLLSLSVMALSLGTVVRTDLAQARRFQDEAAATFLAKGGIEWVVHHLNTLERQDRLWQAHWQDQPALFRGRHLGRGTFDITYVDAAGTQHFGLQDEEARINLNMAPAALLAALPGLTASTAEQIVRQRQERPFVVPEELVGRGLVSPSTFYGTDAQAGLDPYLTVWSGGKINLNTAPLPVLAALLGMSGATAEAIVRYRQGDDQHAGTADDRYFRTVADAGAVPGLDQAALEPFQAWLTVTPTAFRAIATGRIRNGQGADRRHRRLAIIDGATRPRQIRYWRRLE